MFEDNFTKKGQLIKALKTGHKRLGMLSKGGHFENLCARFLKKQPQQTTD